MALLVCLSALSPGSPASLPARVYLPGEASPPILERLELPQELQALALAADGRRAALATAQPSSKPSEPAADIRVHGMDGSVVLTPVQGQVRDLLFVEHSLFAILHRPAKRHEGETILASIDLDARKARRELRLPASARGIESWGAGGALLVASRNEIRTITLPSLRSGPLYRVPGENLCVASLGGSRVLIGQGAALLLVDLADPQARESMPVRERLDAPSPVVSLAVTPDGGRGYAGLGDGRVVAVTLGPLAFDEVGSGLVVSGRRPAPEAAPVAVIEEPAPAPEAAPVAVIEEPAPAPASPPAAAIEQPPPAAQPPPVEEPAAQLRGLPV